jgi:hypothetical protein
MKKFPFLIAALAVAISLPASAQQSYPQDYRPDIGGHSRHGHRDWSQQEGQHKHNVCWDWDLAKGWVWICH